MSWLTVHFDEQTIAALDAAAAEITAHYPTLKVSREDIVRSLVARGIEAIDQQAATCRDVVCPQWLRDRGAQARWVQRRARLTRRSVGTAFYVAFGVTIATVARVESLAIAVRGARSRGLERMLPLPERRFRCSYNREASDCVSVCGGDSYWQEWPIAEASR